MLIITPLQEVADARRIRTKVLENFERATQPSTTEEERRKLLHFVIVGGGPTGVEFGAELYDFLRQVCVREIRFRDHQAGECNFTLCYEGSLIPTWHHILVHVAGM